VLEQSVCRLEDAHQHPDRGRDSQQYDHHAVQAEDPDCVEGVGAPGGNTNAELAFMTDCPVRPTGPLAHDMVWDFVSDWALVTPVPEPAQSQLIGAAALTIGALARYRSRAT